MGCLEGRRRGGVGGGGEELEGGFPGGTEVEFECGNVNSWKVFEESSKRNWIGRKKASRPQGN